METARPRTIGGHTFSPNAADNKEYFAKALKDVSKQLNKTIRTIATPAEVRIDAFIEMPKTIPDDEIILYEAQLLHPVTFPDGDNMAKCYLDMMTGILTIDDDIFYSMDIRKWYSLEPRVEIRITYETAFESDYVYTRMKNRKAVKAGLADGHIELKKL